MTTLGQRLKESRLKAGLKQEQVASAVGIKQPTYQALESGKTQKSAFLPEIAALLNVDAYWLSTGKTASDVDADLKNLLEKSTKITINSSENNEDERIWIDLVNIRFSCGNGESIEFHFDEVLGVRDFSPSFFKKYGVKPENVKLAIAKGDSQEPYICNEDEFAIDLSDTEIKDNEFYAVYFEGEAMLKQIIKEEGGKLILHSLNPKYRDKVISDVNGSSFRVIGRQFYRAG
ncbi:MULTISPECIES: XRE family transcriptional regulator [unclassified Acinetobacter]|uniref:XRE family transcriptional regulator n=1 Tax=unclassified Acinetobacter TaxID=196816 RepID=UPI0029347F32|nr:MULTISPECIES: S24 family peptidase [unclassified Acinetobacter]WOE31955.1 S24 family peptidase [Acinetobacter sp. SAAs470]WOE37423.1 S24 family peptidase [Acinetobacter sp. SAAs474]